MNRTDKNSPKAESGIHGNENADPPKYTAPIYFNDYDKLIESFGKGLSVKLDLDDVFDRGNSTDRYILDRFEKFGTSLQSNGVPVPLLGDGRMELRNREGYSNISLFFSELYSLPWIWYYPAVSTGDNFYLKVTVIPDTVSEELKKGSASELIKALSPDSPNTDNYQQYSSVERAYESEVDLKDRKVMALKLVYKDDPREYTFFIYDELIVMVCAKAEVFDEQWFAKLSFEMAR